MTVTKRQNLICLCLVVLTIFAAIFGYRLTQKKWVLFREAENKYEDKSFNEAIALYSESLSLGSTSAKALLNIGNSYIAIGDFPNGILYYRKYLETHPHDKETRLMLARALGWNGNLQESEIEYQKLLEAADEKPPRS